MIKILCVHRVLTAVSVHFSKFRNIQQRDSYSNELLLGEVAFTWSVFKSAERINSVKLWTNKRQSTGLKTMSRIFQPATEYKSAFIYNNRPKDKFINLHECRLAKRSNGIMHQNAINIDEHFNTGLSGLQCKTFRFFNAKKNFVLMKSELLKSVEMGNSRKKRVSQASQFRNQIPISKSNSL